VALGGQFQHSALFRMTRLHRLETKYQIISQRSGRAAADFCIFPYVEKEGCEEYWPWFDVNNNHAFSRKRAHAC